MPIVPYQTSILARRETLPGQKQPTDLPEPETDYSGLDLAAAAFRQNNVLSNAPQLISDAIASFDDVYDPNYDPLADDQVAGFELYADRFINSASPTETQRIKARINTELRDRRIIQQAGGAGLAASIAAGLVDPITLASMAVPLVGTGTRGVRIAKGIASSVALDSGQEMALHAEQSLRTLGESVINVGAGALLTGALGTLATRVPRSEFKNAQNAFNEASQAISTPAGGIESTGGAARVGFGTTLEDETVAKGGAALLKSLGRINPLARVMQASSKRARILMQEIADVPFLLNKHLQGVATPRSAEGEILAEQAERYRLVQETDAAFAEYRKAGGGLSRGKYAEEIASALRRGDVSMDPTIQRLVGSYRKYFDESLKKLKAAGLVGQDAGVKFAMSYLPRLYDHGKIRATRSQFEDALTDWFGRSGEVDKAEIRTAVADVIDTVTGSLRDHAHLAQGFVGKTGSLNARTLNVPDEVLEPWLVNDIEKIMEGYIRGVTPQLVLKNKFGDMDMRQQMQDVRDEYVALRERAKSNEAKNALTDEMESVLHDIQSVRDILLGKFAKPADPDSLLVKSGRVFRAWNYVRLLGGQVLSSLPDAGRIVARHGLVKTAGKIARLVTDSGMRKLAKAEAHRVGTALEYVLNTRADTLAEIGDELGSSKLDRALRGTSNTFSRVTGMASWNSALKTLAVALEQDAIVRAAKGGKLTKFQRGQLANLGIGDRMIARIAEQLEQHAGGAGMQARGKPSQSIAEEVAEVGARQYERKARPDVAGPVDVADEYHDQARKLHSAIRYAKDIDLSDPAAVSKMAGRKVLSVSQFVRDVGGLVDDGGELAARDVTAKSLPGLVRKAGTDGADMDGIREKLFDAGYFPHKADYNEISDTEIYDAIAQDLTGARLYPGSVSDMVAKVHEERDFVDRLASQGLTRDMSVSQMAARLRELDDESQAIADEAAHQVDAFDEYAALERGETPPPAAAAPKPAPKPEAKPAAAAPPRKPPKDSDLLRANTADWSDREAAAAFEAALLKSSNQVVLTKGVADVPLFMNKELGKTLFQFKSFGMAAVNRMLVPMAQGLSHGDLATLNGAWVMMAIGAMANAARDTAAGFKPATDPTRIAIEAFDRAGFTAFLAEPLDLVSGLVGGPRFGRFTSQSLVETAGGPTFGTAQDLYDTVRNSFTEGGQFDPSVKASDIYRFRKLLPYQNLFYLRRLVNMMEGEFSEAVGVEGAGTKSAGERLTEMQGLHR
jgi:hypothetical protein